MPEGKKRTRNYDKSPEGIAYRNQYNKEHYSIVKVVMKPDFRDKVDERAAADGISRTQLIVNALTAYMEKDGE